LRRSGRTGCLRLPISPTSRQVAEKPEQALLKALSVVVFVPCRDDGVKGRRDGGIAAGELAVYSRNSTLVATRWRFLALASPRNRAVAGLDVP
jgi:hypothetical protein